MKATKIKTRATKNNPTITYFRTGVARKWKEEWYERGVLHRVGGPAFREWSLQGILIREEWRQNGDLHCTETYADGVVYPAYTTWYEIGKVSEKIWYVEGKRHRTDGPARLAWTKDGVQTVSDWYYEGKYHNLNGPARQHWTSSGNLELSERWVDGVLCRDCLSFYSATDLGKIIPQPVPAQTPQPSSSAQQNIPTELTIEGVRYISVEHLLRNININYLLQLSKK